MFHVVARILCMKLGGLGPSPRPDGGLRLRSPRRLDRVHRVAGIIHPRPVGPELRAHGPGVEIPWAQHGAHRGRRPRDDQRDPAGKPLGMAVGGSFGDGDGRWGWPFGA